MGEAVELILYNADTEKFEVGHGALNVLRGVKGPVSVVAVCGRARQGKSFILNQLLHSTCGFQVGSTHRPCTKGLWMWSAPQRRIDSGGNAFHMVLLDTEGIDAYDQTAQYSTQVFSLAVLLSSLFLYNQMGGIDEAALDRLSLVTEMTKHIRVCATGAGDDASLSELREFAPSFVWLLRDFYLRLEDEHGRKVTASDYLETALMPVPGAGAAVDAKNAIRASIKSLFPDRCCATLVRPMHDEQALVNLDQTPTESLRPEFQEGVEQLLKLVLRKAQPKRIGSFAMTGPVLAGLTEAYVQAINDGAVPTISTAWQGVTEAECRRAADAAEAQYCSCFDKGVAPEEGALDAEHSRALAAARQAYIENAVGDDATRAAHEAKFLDACASRFSQVRGRKLAEAAAAVNELLLKAGQLVQTSLAAEDASPAEVQSQLSQFLEQYVAMAAGPTKWTRLVQFLKATYPSIMAGMVARQEDRCRREVARLMEELQREGRRADAAAARAEHAERHSSNLAGELEVARQQLVEQSGELARTKVDRESKALRLAALEGHLRELQLVSEKRLQAAQTEGEARSRALTLEHESEVASFQARLTDEQQRAAELLTEVGELTSRSRGLEAQLASTQAENSDSMRRYAASKAETAALAKQLEALQAQVTMLQLERATLLRDRDKARAEAASMQSLLDEFDVEIEGRLQEAEVEKAREQARSSCCSSRSPSRFGSVYHDDE